MANLNVISQNRTQAAGSTQLNLRDYRKSCSVEAYAKWAKSKLILFVRSRFLSILSKKENAFHCFPEGVRQNGENQIGDGVGHGPGNIVK